MEWRLKNIFQKKTNLCSFDCKTKNFKMAARVLRTLKKKENIKMHLEWRRFSISLSWLPSLCKPHFVCDVPPARLFPQLTVCSFCVWCLFLKDQSEAFREFSFNSLCALPVYCTLSVVQYMQLLVWKKKILKIRKIFCIFDSFFKKAWHIYFKCINEDLTLHQMGCSVFLTDICVLV